MTEDHRLVALGALPNIDLAVSEIDGVRKSVARFGMIFPIQSVFATIHFISDPLLHHSGIGFQPIWLKANRPWIQMLLTISLGAIVPLLFVAALIGAWMNTISVMTVVGSFLALEVALMLGFRFIADSLWYIDFAPDEPCWLDLDRAVHELGLSKDFIRPSFMDASLDDLEKWLMKLRTELSEIAHASDA